MRNAIFTIILLSIVNLPIDLSGQSRETDKKGYFGIGIGMGGFAPKDVNDYLRDYWDSQIAGYYTTGQFGFPEIYVNFVVQISGGTYLSQNVELKGLVEVGVAPKLIVIHDSEFFNFIRYSPGVECNYHFPTSNNKTFFLGGGFLYHNMKFEKWNASSLSPRFRIGFNIQNAKNSVVPYLAVDYAKGKTGKSEMPTLNYSGAILGINFKF